MKSRGAALTCPGPETYANCGVFCHFGIMAVGPQAVVSTTPSDCCSGPRTWSAAACQTSRRRCTVQCITVLHSMDQGLQYGVGGSMQEHVLLYNTVVQYSTAQTDFIITVQYCTHSMRAKEHTSTEDSHVWVAHGRRQRAIVDVECQRCVQIEWRETW